MPSWWVNFFAAVTNILLFILITETLIHYWTVPEYFKKQRYGRFFAALVVGVLVNGTATLFATWSIIQPFSASEYHDLFWQWENLIYGVFFVVTALTAISITMTLMYDWFVVQTRLTELQAAKTKTELEFLKAQINPHFLFNSLNSIYGQIDKKNTDARELLLKFSDLLRYQLYECSGDLIEIEKEVAYLRTYLAVQKPRQDCDTRIELALNGQLSGYKMAPLLFIPFVENAFKYLSRHHGSENYILIELSDSQKGGRTEAFHFRCQNSIEPNRVRRVFGEKGLGFENVKRRLELTYPRTHHLERRESESSFIVELVIAL